MAKLFSNLYKLYTSDLKDGDVERLLRSEAPDVYRFYLDSVAKQNHASMNSGQRKLALVKDLALAFLERLSPVRRIAFSLAFVIFFYASIINVWFWAILSFLAIVALLAFEVAEKLTAASELDIAKNIQEELVMSAPPANSSLKVASYSRPAKTVGGDFLNYFPLNCEEKKHFYLLGDISGKGMLAALYMVRVHSLLVYLSKTLGTGREVMIELNRVLNTIFKPGLFFTAAAIEVGDGNKLKLFRAGHTPFLYYNAEKKEVVELKPDGIGIGLRNNGLFESTIKEIELELKPGDALLIYSDGVTEAIDEHEHEYGLPRLQKNFLKNGEKPADQIMQALLRSITNFTYNTPMRDDITVLVLQNSRT